MAAIVTQGMPDIVGGTQFGVGPIKVADANETNLGTPDTSIVINTEGVSLMAVQIVFANYTSVTVKAQRSLDGATWSDITDMTSGTSGGYFAFDPKSPRTRLSIAGTLSGSADTMGVWCYMEYAR